MNISHDDYSVRYDEGDGLIQCEGSFRLRGSEEYKPILDLLLSAANAAPEQLTLDLRELKFLNSSGINTLSKFIIQVRKHPATKVLVRGSTEHPWQGKSLKNFQRLLPSLELVID